MGLGPTAACRVAWRAATGVGSAATAVQLLGIHGLPGVGSRLQRLGFWLFGLFIPLVAIG